MGHPIDWEAMGVFLGPDSPDRLAQLRQAADAAEERQDWPACRVLQEQVNDHIMHGPAKALVDAFGEPERMTARPRFGGPLPDQPHCEGTLGRAVAGIGRTLDAIYEAEKGREE